ncbi:MAG: M55 family metallopeptidase [Candidatus Bathyarchaeales archaeon]
MRRKIAEDLKVVVIVDMEGISGIDDYRQILSGNKEFEEFGRTQITEDVNAVIRGLKAAGVTEIRVVDAHGSGGPSTNIIPEKLEKDVKLYQDPNIFQRVKQALDKTLSAAVLVGFHAMAGTKDGFITHTITLEPQVKINGMPVGETALTAFVLADYDIPVIMATGDQALVREALAFLPEIETAQLKTSTDRRTTKCLTLAQARKIIEETATRAVSKIGKVKPLRVKRPAKIEIIFPTKEHADSAEIIPRAKRSGETAISYVAHNAEEGEAFLYTAISLANRLRLKPLFAELEKLEGFKKIEKDFMEKMVADWLSQ